MPNLPQPRQQYRQVPRGRTPLILVVVNAGPGTRRPVWAPDLPNRVRQTLNSEIATTATHAYRAASTGQHLNSPRMGAIYTNHDQTQIRIDVEDQETGRWVLQTLHRALNLAVLPTEEINDGFTWYSAVIEFAEVMNPPEDIMQDTVAYANGLLPRHVAIGEGSMYGRRELPNNGGYLIYVGLSADGKQRLKEQSFILRVGALGPAFFYPVEEGEEGPRWHGANPVRPPSANWSAPPSLAGASGLAGGSALTNSSPASSVREGDRNEDLEQSEGDALALAGMQDDAVNEDEDSQPLQKGKGGRSSRKKKEKE
jgi:hypothetical protein